MQLFIQVCKGTQNISFVAINFTALLKSFKNLMICPVFMLFSVFFQKGFSLKRWFFPGFNSLSKWCRKRWKKSAFITRWKLKALWKKIKFMKKYTWNNLPVQKFAIPLSSLSGTNASLFSGMQDDPWKHSIQTSSTTVNDFFELLI